VETRGRSSANFGAPLETVTKLKQRRIKRTALKFISENKIYNKDFRFDVVEILKDNIEHIENAFW
jgi:putative endonuclease